MPAPRLQAALFVAAIIRRAGIEGAFAAVVRRGAQEAGAVFLKLNLLDGTAIVLSPSWQGDARVWVRASGPDPVPEADADARLAKEIRFDPDIWIVEIEDRAGRVFHDEPLV